MTKQVEDLMGQELDNMSPEELMAFIKNLRTSRQTPKATSKRAKATKKAGVKATDKVRSKLSDLTPQERLALIAELEGE